MSLLPFLKKSLQVAEIALAEKDTEIIVNELFDRLVVVRNQIIKGGATWVSPVNHDQVRDCARFWVR